MSENTPLWVLIFFVFSFHARAFNFQKADTGLDRESAHLLQLHAVKGSCCTAANPGATGRLADLLLLGLQLYSSFTSQHEAATGGLIPYPIQ